MKSKYISMMAIIVMTMMSVSTMFGQTLVEPTTELGDPAEDVTSIRLSPGKLIGLERLPESGAMTGVVNNNFYFDAMLSDKYFDDNSESVVKNMFIDGAAMIKKTGAKIWGVHMPYKTSGKSNLDVADNATISNLKKIMGWVMEYLKPHHMVFHPGNSVIYDHNQSTFNPKKTTARDALVKLQVELDALNAKYGTNTIICLENCTQKVAYDPLSLLDFLDYPGLEKVKICFDTGHALVPQNGNYSNKDSRSTIIRNGDVVEMLKVIGTRLGTLHITQNHGGVKPVHATLDEHLEPLADGLIDWGEFYYTLLTHNQYRGCFLYETEYISEREGSKSTVSSCRKNYDNIVLPAYQEYLDNNVVK